MSLDRVGGIEHHIALIHLGVAELFCNPALIEYYASVGDLFYLGYLERVEDDRLAVVCKLKHELVYLGLRAHVHALRGIVEQQHVCAEVQKLALKWK